METEKAKFWLKILNTRKNNLVGLKGEWYWILKESLESLIKDREILKATYLKIKKIDKG